MKGYNVEVQLPNRIKIEFQVSEVNVKAGHLPEIKGHIIANDFLEIAPYLMGDHKKYDLEILLLAHLIE